MKRKLGQRRCWLTPCWSQLPSKEKKLLLMIAEGEQPTGWEYWEAGCSLIGRGYLKPVSRVPGVKYALTADGQKRLDERHLPVLEDWE